MLALDRIDAVNREPTPLEAACLFGALGAMAIGDEHAAIVRALAAKDETLAVRLMNQHLLSVEKNLAFDRKVPGNDLSMALS